MTIFEGSRDAANSRLAVRALLLGTAAVATLVCTGTAFAQASEDQQASEAEAAGSQGEGDIVVTARRRSESLSRVPAAITAFSGDQLTQRNITTQSDLQTSVPGLTLRQTQGQNSLTYSIRGQTVDAFSGSPSAVVAYVNEVQFTAGGAASFFDLSSVQVLKGPQGTLFGRNATGGAVLYTTTQPTNEYGGYVQLRGGNLKLIEGQGAINIPIVDDKVLLRVAFDLIHRDGFIRNVYRDETLGVTSRQSVRGSLTLKPSSAFTNTTVAEYDRSGGNNTGASYLYSVYQCGEVNNGTPLACGAAGTYNPAAMDAIFGPGAWNQYLAAHPKAFPGGINAYLLEQRRQGTRYANAVAKSDHTGRDWFVTNTSNLELSPDLTVKNIFGISRSYARDNQLQNGDPYGIQFTENLSTGLSGNRQTVKQWSNEFQLQGKGLGGDLVYILGAYYAKQKTTIVYPQTYFDLLPFVPYAGYTPAFNLENETKAVFAQASYDVGSLTGLTGLKVTGGIRYTWEEVTLNHIQPSPNFGAPEQKVKFKDPSWEVGLEYQASSDLLTYVKTRGSFRAGGLNGVAPPILAPASGGGDLFGPEHVKDIEAGLKFAGRAFGSPARFNLAVFNQWITGVQRVQFPIGPQGNVIAVTINVPKAEIRGIEADGSFSPVEWLELGASGAYTKAKFTGNTAVLFGQTFTFGPYPDTPKWSGSVYGVVNVPLANDVGTLRLRAETYAQTGLYFSSTAGTSTPRTRLPGYALVNGRIDLVNIDGTGLTVGLFGKNLLDKQYFLGGLAQGVAFGVNTAAVGEPRTYGAEIKFAF